MKVDKMYYAIFDDVGQKIDEVLIIDDSNGPFTFQVRSVLPNNPQPYKVDGLHIRHLTDTGTPAHIPILDKLL